MVLSVGVADQVIKTPFHDCRLALSSEEKTALKFAVVSYSFLNRPKNAVVPISPGSTWTAGSPVYIDITNCRTALEPRMVRADPGNKKTELHLKLIAPHG